MKSTTSASPPQRRLSVPRVLIVLCLFAALIYGMGRGTKQVYESLTLTQIEPWFASYVDVTSTPTYPFEQMNTPQNSNVVLAFIVSATNNPCVPSWGTYYTLDQAAVSLDLDRRIARFQQQSGRVAISFGGALNDELALKCTDEQQLLAAYATVVERYNIDTIDLDLENAGLQDQAAAARRARVIAQLQQARRAAGKPFAVWVTLPVAPQGLTPVGTDAVTALLKGGVDLAGVNLMTMNYGESKQADESMQEASKQALVHTHRQLDILYTQANLPLSSASLWQKIGVTPMIGQNDITGEVFSLEDAQGLNTFALDRGVGRMSMWSANRDRPCGDNYVNTKVVSDSCSGITTGQYEFARVLSTGFLGDLKQSAELITVEDKPLATPILDDPNTSPYQVWSESGSYIKGTKVVWRGNVYEAKWWTRGDLPDDPVLQDWQTPWQLIGPVLPGEKPVIRPTLPKGTYPTWSGTQIYQAGDRILFENIPFQAKWWNQGQSPAAAAAQADSSPWEPLTDAEIQKVLDALPKATSSDKKQSPR